MKKILIVVGTRPNFIKITRFPSVVKSYPALECKIVHTGQHFDENMSSVFFRQFGIEPDFFLSVEPKGTPVSRMADIMKSLEKVVNDYKPHLIIVPGDVDSTLAAAITANRMNIPLAHLESGLRSYDRTMPEEFNRLLTDDLADYYFVTEQSGYDNLLREGKNKDAIYFTGNTMIDTMVAFNNEIVNNTILVKLNAEPKRFALMTMHRPATVDNGEGLNKLLSLINLITERNKLVFPVHPRTVKNLKHYGLYSMLLENQNLLLCAPLDYFAFQNLILNCLYIVTDSGGIQEESTFRQVPCLTFRLNTERPVTITLGTNELIPYNEESIKSRIESIEKGKNRQGEIPPLWDGKATDRVVKIIAEII